MDIIIESQTPHTFPVDIKATNMGGNLYSIVIDDTVPAKTIVLIINTLKTLPGNTVISSAWDDPRCNLINARLDFVTLNKDTLSKIEGFDLSKIIDALDLDEQYWAVLQDKVQKIVNVLGPLWSVDPVSDKTRTLTPGVIGAFNTKYHELMRSKEPAAVAHVTGATSYVHEDLLQDQKDKNGGEFNLFLWMDIKNAMDQAIAAAGIEKKDRLSTIRDEIGGININDKDSTANDQSVIASLKEFRKIVHIDPPKSFLSFSQPRQIL